MQLTSCKLGYGGTKEEMMRLIDDANKVKKANGEMADLSIDSFADIVEAIHTVQDEMGIAGTTADEAASTISGSFGMLKGAWSNLISGLMDENANIPDLVSDVTESAVTLFDNVKPKIKQFFDAIPEAIHNMLAPYPEVQSTVDGVIQGIKNIATTASNTVKFIVDHWNVIAPILAGVAAAVGVITGAITIYNAVMAVKTAMDAAQVTSLGALIAAKWADFAATTAVLAPYALIVAAIAAVIAIVVLCVKHWDEIKAKVKEVAEKIGNAVHEMAEKIKEKFKSIVDGLKELPHKMFELGGNLLEGLWNGIKNMGEWLKEKIRGLGSAITDALKAVFGIHSPSTVFRDEIGENLALGLGEGFEDEMADVEKRMTKAIPTDFDVSARVSATSSTAKISRSGSSEDAMIVKLLMAILPELYDIIVRALQDGVKIQWKERELARLVKTYAD